MTAGLFSLERKTALVTGGARGSASPAPSRLLEARRSRDHHAPASARRPRRPRSELSRDAARASPIGRDLATSEGAAGLATMCRGAARRHRHPRQQRGRDLGRAPRRVSARAPGRKRAQAGRGDAVPGRPGDARAARAPGDRRRIRRASSTSARSTATRRDRSTISPTRQQGRPPPPHAGARAPSRPALDHGERVAPGPIRTKMTGAAARARRDALSSRPPRSGASRTPPTSGARSSISLLRRRLRSPGASSRWTAGLAITPGEGNPNDGKRAARRRPMFVETEEQKHCARRSAASRSATGTRYYLECSRSGKSADRAVGRPRPLRLPRRQHPVGVRRRRGAAISRARDRLRGARDCRNAVVPAHRLDCDLRRVARHSTAARSRSASGCRGWRRARRRWRSRSPSPTPARTRTTCRRRRRATATSTASAAPSTTPRRSTTADGRRRRRPHRHRREAPGRGKLSLFIVDPNAPGPRAAPDRGRGDDAGAAVHALLRRRDGPGTRLIGDEGDGFKQLFAGLNPERIMAAALENGIGLYALDKAAAYARERSRLGRRRSARTRASPIRSRRRRSRSSSRG